jgi:hypothetical protein
MSIYTAYNFFCLSVVTGFCGQHVVRPEDLLGSPGRYHSFRVYVMATPPLPFLTSTQYDRSRTSNSAVPMVKTVKAPHHAGAAVFMSPAVRVPGAIGRRGPSPRRAHALLGAKPTPDHGMARPRHGMAWPGLWVSTVASCPPTVLAVGKPWSAMACHGLPWPAMVCHGLPWSAMVCYGLPWPAMVCHGLPWSAVVCHGLLWPAMACHGLPWSAVVCHGLPWSAMVCHGLPWSATVCRGLPWSAMVCHGLPWHLQVALENNA